MIYFILVLVVIGIIAYFGSKADDKPLEKDFPAGTKTTVNLDDNWEKEQEEKYKKYLIKMDKDYNKYLNYIGNEKILEILEKGSPYIFGQRGPVDLPKYGRLLCVEINPDNVIKKHGGNSFCGDNQRIIFWRTKENGTYVKWSASISKHYVGYSRRDPAKYKTEFELIKNDEFKKWADCKDTDNEGNYILERI